MSIKARIKKLESVSKPEGEFLIYDRFGNAVDTIPQDADLITDEFVILTIIDRDGVKTSEIPENVYYKTKNIWVITYDIAKPEAQK